MICKSFFYALPRLTVTILRSFIAMKIMTASILLLFWSFFGGAIAAPSYQDILNFYSRQNGIFADEVFPRISQSDTVTVDVNFTLLSLGEFNEHDGYLEINGLVDIVWTDELIAESSGPPVVTEISVPRDDVWVPTISIFNSHSNISMIGDGSTDVRITMPTTASGEMKWSPAVISKTNCAVDSTYFPFDTQKCNITITPWGYSDLEVNFSINVNESLNTFHYHEHELWTLKEYKSGTENKESQAFLFYELTLQRKPKYFLLTYLLPFLMLIFLSNLIFLMPSASGERVVFAMLIFLSIAVLMAMVTKSLPKSSTQMSILSFYFTTMIVVVSIITYLAILSLTIHSKEPRSMVPHRITRFIALCGCYENKHKDDLSKLKNSKVSPLTVSEYDDDDDGYFSHPKFQKQNMFEVDDDGPIVARKDDKVYTNDYDMTWKHVAKTFDKMCFITFLFVNIGITTMFMTPLIANY